MRGDRGLGEPRRHADAQCAGHELEQRPTPGFVEPVEPRGEPGRQLRLAERGQGGDDLRQRRDRGRLRAGILGRRRPHQRHRLGEVADIVVGQREQHGIGALGDQGADQAGLGVSERQRPGDGGQRVAALGIGRGAEIIGEQPQLGIAAGLIGEAVEQGREAVHEAAPSVAGLHVDALGFLFLAVADHVQRPRLQAARPAPMHQCILGAVGHPDVGGAGGDDGGGEAVPVAVVGDHQRQLDAALAGARPHPHPARRERRHRIGKPAGPAVLQRRRRAQRDGAGEIGLAGIAHRPQLAERDVAFVIAGDRFHRPVQVDRFVVAGPSDQRHDPLRLAERIGADQMGALAETAPPRP